MNTASSKFMRFLMQPWMVINTLKADSGTCFMEIGAVLEFYMHMQKVHKVPYEHFLADVHFLTGGSKLILDSLYQTHPQVARNRAVLKLKYSAITQESCKSVGPMFLHYLVASLQDKQGNYKDFCANRMIGDVYLEPSLLTGVAGPQEAFALYA